MGIGKGEVREEGKGRDKDWPPNQWTRSASADMCVFRGGCMSNSRWDSAYLLCYSGVFRI